MLAILVEPYIFRIYAILTANLNKCIATTSPFLKSGLYQGG